jgi:hypothetical protein
MIAPSESPPQTPAPGQSSYLAAGPPKTPHFPPSNAPRVWFLTDGLSPIAISLSKLLLEHGDYVVAGVLSEEFAGERGDGLRTFLAEAGREVDIEIGSAGSPAAENDDTAKGMGKKWKERFRALALDGR